MTDRLAFIGFGEAAQAFAGALAVPMRAYDLNGAGYAACAVEGCDSNAAAIAGATLVLSLVTADQALAAARETARTIAPGALFCDMNSVAPDTKRVAARAIGDAGGRYVDVAVMAPVHPQRLSVPLLVAGPHAGEAAAALAALGFRPSVAGARIGDAAAIKMIRSVMVKGIEALSAECLLAAEAAGVADAVIASLDASAEKGGWAQRLDYNLDRMLAHGLRRAAEMEEVVTTLDALGTGSVMTRATVERQRALGRIGRGVPEGIAAKVALIAGREAQAA